MRIHGESSAQIAQAAGQLPAGAENKMIGRVEGIINSMTPAERAKPELIKASRKRRIAIGAGVQVRSIVCRLAAWARWSRPWTLAAWMFLTLGIAMGSWWAYYELGWGGWWFWDPVENASFMPWLLGTALIHSLSVTEKRGSFKNWTVLLAISAFSLSLLGTFLVRSGVLTSVHAFATDPTRGIFILAFLVVVIGASLALFAWRAPSVGLGGRFALVSRESLLLTNNVLLVVACGTVLLGTLYPLLIDALGVGKISVGPPYFNAVFVPVMLPVMFLIGIGPFARWKQASIPEILRVLRWAFAAAVVVAIALPLIYGEWKTLTAVALLAAAWIVLSGLSHFTQRVRATRGTRGFVQAALGQPASFIGMHLAHLGVAVFIVGVSMVSSFEQEKDIKMGAGDVVEVAGYSFKFNGVFLADTLPAHAQPPVLQAPESGRPEDRLAHPD